MNNKMVEYIAERVADITRKSPDCEITISVLMPETASDDPYPRIFIQARYLSATSHGMPKTTVKIVQ